MQLGRFVQRVDADVRASVAHVLVLGGGPIGLLTAVELALLGHKVTVKEARDSLSRLNILRLWPETAMTLSKTYGLLHVDNGVQWAQSKPTISTTRLQIALLKVALIVGVRVEIDPRATRTAAADGFCLARDARSYDVLVVATGHRPALLQALRQEATRCREVGADCGDAVPGSARGGGRRSSEHWDSDKSGSAKSESETGSERASGPFAVGEKANATATALVAHFEVTDRNESAAKYAKEFPHTFDWTINDALTFDSSDAAVRKRALERFGAAERLCCAIGPRDVAAALSARYATAANGGTALENVLMYSNKQVAKRAEGGNIELPNLIGVPPSFYFIMTLKEAFVRELVGRMAQRTAADEVASAVASAAPAASPRPPPAIPTTAKEALEWALEQAGRADGCVSRAAFDAEAGLAATTVAAVFTQSLGAAKRLAPFPASCRLLCNVPTGFADGGAYEEGLWQRSTDVFDFSVSRHMRSAVEVVDEIDGQPRVQESEGCATANAPLLVAFVGDALQEPFWPEGLGINRGVHGAFDSVYCCHKWLAARGSPDEVAKLLRERRQLYRSFTMPMSGKTRRMLLGFNATNNEPLPSLTKVYQRATVDPTTRYNVQAFGFADLSFPQWSASCRRQTKYDK